MLSVTPECKGCNNTECNLQYTIESDVSITPPTAPESLNINIKGYDIKVGQLRCDTCKFNWAYTKNGEEVNYVEQGFDIVDDHSHDEGCEI